MKNFFQKCAERQGLTPNDIVFELARMDVRVTSQTVRNWFEGTVPSLGLADPLAALFKVDRSDVLEAMLEMRKARKAAAHAS